jgi:hypothetical protein
LPVADKLKEDEVTAAILRLSKNKAPGTNRIPNRVLRLIIYKSPALFTRIFQTCLNQGYHLEHFRKACTVVLRKLEKPDYTDLLAYRLITLLNILEKALESIIVARLRNLTEIHALFPES